MAEEKTYTLDEAHLYFAKTLNGRVWELLEKTGRSAAENELMLMAAYASCQHWLAVGTGVHHQRAEWLIARVHTVLDQAGQALQHAARCLELTHEFADLMVDFDRAYAFEGAARAHALAGNREQALQYWQQAEAAGQMIANEEDRRIFQGDLHGGNWYGLTGPGGPRAVPA